MSPWIERKRAKFPHSEFPDAAASRDLPDTLCSDHRDAYTRSRIRSGMTGGEAGETAPNLSAFGLDPGAHAAARLGPRVKPEDRGGEGLPN